MNTQHACFRIDDPFSFLTKELLESEYVTNGLTDRQIAEKHHVGSKVTVWRRRQFYGIPNRVPTKSNKHGTKNRSVFLALEDAVKMREDGLDYYQIAERLGCSLMSVCRRMKELGLARETPHPQHRLRFHVPLTDLQRRFLLGTLLGDGSIARGGMFQCNHCSAQLAYIRWKVEVLSTLMSPNFKLEPHYATDGASDKKHVAYYMRTMQNENLRVLRHVFYPEGVKVFPIGHLSESTFDSLSLAVWYMDDGCRAKDSAQLSTYGFGYNGNLDILKLLNNKFGLMPKMLYSDDENRSPDCRHYLSFSVSEAAKLFTIISPHVLPCMAYKLPREYRAPAPAP